MTIDSVLHGFIQQLQTVFNTKASDEYSKFCVSCDSIIQDFEKRKSAIEVAFKSEVQLTMPNELTFHRRCNEYNTLLSNLRGKLSNLHGELTKSQANITIYRNQIALEQTRNKNIVRQLEDTTRACNGKLSVAKSTNVDLTRRLEDTLAQLVLEQTGIRTLYVSWKIQLGLAMAS